MKKDTKNGAIIGAIAAVASSVARPLVNKATDAISEKLTYSIDISSAEFNLAEGLRRHFKNIPDKCFIDIGSEFENGIKIKYKKNTAAWDRTSSNVSTTTIFRGWPITFGLKNGFDGGDERSNQNSITLSTLNVPAAKRNLKRFIRLMAEEQHKHDVSQDRKTTCLWGPTWHGEGLCSRDLTIKRRTFQNTFIPYEQEVLIKTSIDEFKSKRDWYIKNNIPYHFGFLLYGEGGTGKTSLAQCIAEYADAQLISFPGDRIADLPKMLGGPISTSAIDPSVYRIILIEDIDCGFAQRAIDTIYDDEKDEFKSLERRVGLASILNTLDGLAAPTNVIYVFTTNHIEKLDPALIRPGRCDVRLNIPGVTVETFTRFCKYHNYDTDRIKGITDDEIRSDVTFAELQTQVMKGDTIEDLIKLIKK